MTFYASGHSNTGVSSKPFALDSIPALRSGFYLVLSDSTGLTGFNAYYKDSSYYLSQYPAFTFTQVDSLSKKYDRNLKSYLLFFHLDKSASSLWEYFGCRLEKFQRSEKTFNAADAVANDRYIFDIKGNQYRLIALVIFKVRTVFILFIGTHKEYDKIEASKVQFKK